MKKSFLLIFFITISIIYAKGQSTNFRAQGNYYSAKEQYQLGNYNAALDYIYKAKKSLGGTNIQLQYMHVMAAYHAKKFSEANTELETFFKIQAKEIQYIAFDKTVDPLTNDEVKEITKIIDKVEEAIAVEEADKPRKEKEARRELIVAKLNKLIEESSGVGYTIVYEGKNFKTVVTEFTYYTSPLSYSSNTGKYTFIFKDKKVSTRKEYGKQDYVTNNEYTHTVSGFNFRNFLSWSTNPPSELNTGISLILRFSISHRSGDRESDGIVIDIFKDKPDAINEIINLVKELKELESK